MPARHKVRRSGGPYLVYLVCQSREPSTEAERESLRAALPARFDTWTVTESGEALNFEVECGMKRCMGLKENWDAGRPLPCRASPPRLGRGASGQTATLATVTTRIRGTRAGAP